MKLYNLMLAVLLFNGAILAKNNKETGELTGLLNQVVLWTKMIQDCSSVASSVEDIAVKGIRTMPVKLHSKHINLRDRDGMFQVREVSVKMNGEWTHFGYEVSANDNGRSYSYSLFNKDGQEIAHTNYSPINRSEELSSNNPCIDTPVFDLWKKFHGQ